MPARRALGWELWLTLAAGLALCAAAAGSVSAGASEHLAITAVAAVAIGLPIVFVIVQIDPAYTLAAGIALSPFSSNWSAMGIPGAVAPDRWFLVLGIACVILRAPGARDRPKLRLEPVHWVLAAAVLYVLGSQAAAGTLTDKADFFTLFDSFGIVPFALFLVAPVVFRTPRQRQILLTALVALGAYLGLTALVETLNLNALVFPRYILDPSYGIHFGQARGPFAEAAVNGVGLYACAVAAAMAAMSWGRGVPRLVAIATGILCLFGTFATMQRAAWLGAVVATVAVIVLTRDAKRLAKPVAAVVAIGVVAVLTVLPSLVTQARDVTTHGSLSVTDRYNMYATAENMVMARPLTGFGWGTYLDNSPNYYVQGADLPPISSDYGFVHSYPLEYAAEIGLIGVLLWGGGLTLAVGGGLMTRGGRGDLRLWKMGLVAVATFYLVNALVNPPSKPFPTLILMLFAGVAWSGRYAEDRAGAARSHP